MFLDLRHLDTASGTRADDRNQMQDQMREKIIWQPTKMQCIERDKGVNRIG